MEIKSATFVISNSDVSKCPQGDLPEYAFIGRSNVGKSSLINMLVRQKQLANTSQKPGKTLLINHFLINNSWYLVDLPGYGYAQRSKQQREELGRIIGSYIAKREQLVNLFILIDIRHEAQAIDLEFINKMGQAGVPFAIVFTKSDKLSRGKAEEMVGKYKQRLSEDWEELPPIFVTSSAKADGRAELLSYIDKLNRDISKQ
ncbi:GTP-binding protein [Porphyromonas crevioricanis]|uniref:Probable GTP-binding protein EngB n=2 Tax=Porphyromonas crevioricanis TaxID=393921 RepID=A0A0A2FP23_9PORP|nr:ribosome biogenesis GTP-binding protein YihA/YsxC [Porphyromonas crevioricanis]KGN90029.1 GTP-binding protein [Porphyromonas crevioricanis]KGN94208.1 GTP-binding protein [Porphyromonas crevioricanis]SJZ68600.1 GTP-binding protein [Porphyromonas crevioricanis]SQH72234.1 Probable GTP-binding protein EngB [Porphyromonas crevioricanis]GAD04415.1 GTP-binding protein EngB [Porphyromonas crevioricanis JCM 15906]